MADERFDRVVQLRLSQRQHRFLRLAAATEDHGTSYAPVVRHLIDEAIAHADPKFRNVLDGSDEEFMQRLAESL